MNLNFNQIKCLNLLKERRILQKNGELSEFSRHKNNKLFAYLNLLENQNFWINREKLIQMLDGFVKKNITIEELLDQFFHLRSSNRLSMKVWEKKLQQETFTVLPESFGFSKMVSYLYSLLDVYDSEVSFKTNIDHPELIYYGVSADYLKLEIEKNILPKMKEYCDKF